MMLFWIWLVACATALYLFLKRKHEYFKDLGINHLPPVPIAGNMLNVMLGRQHVVSQILELYRAFPEDRFVGRFEFYNPITVIRDLELIKQICVKDFEQFLDHRVTIDEEHDPLFGRNLFSLKGQKWRDMRSTLSPAFTGSKMRLMVPFILDCGQDMIKFLKEKMETGGVNYIDLDTDELTTHFANDVIASCAFGLKVNSLEDETNEFYLMGKETASFSMKRLLTVFAYISFPSLMKRLKITLFSRELGDFFRNIVLGTMKNREENNIIRPDMIHLLMEAKKGKLAHEHKGVNENAGFATVEESSAVKRSAGREWTDDDLVAQAILFFVAGFGTVSTATKFLLYELATNPEIQDKLMDEINDINNSRSIDYNTIQEMKYMDMVVSESLRLWSPAGASDRKCLKSYNIGRANSNSTQDTILQPGHGVWFPTWALHRNPEYFPEPDKFDPERFSDENKHKIKPFTYMPFGAGPRNCIGSRFALMEVKILVHQILTHFRLEPCAKTTIPAELATNSFALRMNGGDWLRFRPRY